MPADNRTALTAATRHRSQSTRERARAALRRLDADGTPITVVAVATAAGVSRSLLYRDPDLRAEIDQIRARDPRGATTRRPAAERASDASLQQRLAAALEDNRSLRDQNHRLTEQIAVLLGEQRATTAPRPSARPIGPCS